MTLMSAKKRKAKKAKAKLCIDVGCGNNPQPGFVGMDVRKLPGVDVVHNAEEFPWPFEDSTVHVIMMSHFVEHVKPWLTVDLMNECWRVLKPGGVCLIATPYAGSFRYFQDPTHCNPWNEATVGYFIEGQPLYDIYKPSPWALERMSWYPQGDLEVALRKVELDEEAEKGDNKHLRKEPKLKVAKKNTD